MIIIGFCNLKGGVGKTTACQNIAVALAKTGRRVAVVDMDPQSNLSAGFGVTPGETDPQVFDLLSGGAAWDDIVCRKEGVDIIPSSLNLVMAELNQTGPVSQDTVLRDALRRIDQDKYDFVLLDSPPQLGIFTRNVLAACSKIIVPMDGGFYSLFGLRLLNGAMPVFRERLNPELEIMGVLMTNYNPRLYIARHVYDEVCRTFGHIVFRNCVRQNVSLVEASSMGMSIFEYSPKSRGAACYRDVTRELLDKLSGHYEEDEEEEEHPVVAVPVSEPEPEPVNETVSLGSVPEAWPDLPELSEDDGLIEVPLPGLEPEPGHEPEAEAEPEVVYSTSRLGDYEEGIKQSVLDMLPEARRPMWNQILGAVGSLTRDEIDARELRATFEDSDKERYKFYVLNDEKDTFWQVMYADQLIDPMRCVMKFDEYEGSAEVYI